MKVQIQRSTVSGTVETVPSKSVSHRILIAGVLSGNHPQDMTVPINSLDMIATKTCMTNMFEALQSSQAEVVLPCGESGSTFRFLIPIVSALGLNGIYPLEGRLANRPLTGYYEELTAHGCKLSPQGSNPFTSHGKLVSGVYTLPGDISSQFITGLLLALPILHGDSELRVTGTLESRPYVDITLQVLKKAGIKIGEEGNVFKIQGNQVYRLPAETATEGDWSNHAFWFSYGALTGQAVTSEHMNLDSAQGDKKILHILERFGATVTCAGPRENATVTVQGGPGKLKGIDIDAKDIPDLVPVLSAVAAGAEGRTTIRNAERLKLKESDRLESTGTILRQLGATIEILPDGFVIDGQSTLPGGATVDSYNDHRIAMTAAVAAGICENPIEITTAQAVRKSYPSFYEEYKKLGGTVEISEASE